MSAENELENLASDLKFIRESFGTQTGFAKRFGYKTSYLSRLESGKNNTCESTVNSFLKKTNNSDMTARIAPKSLCFADIYNHFDWAFLFRLMAWKLTEMENHFMSANITKDSRKVAAEIRKARIVCEQIAEEDIVTKPTFGIFSNYPKGWDDYMNFRFNIRLEYLFKLLRKSRTWWG